MSEEWDSGGRDGKTSGLLWFGPEEALDQVTGIGCRLGQKSTGLVDKGRLVDPDLAQGLIATMVKPGLEQSRVDLGMELHSEAPAGAESLDAHIVDGEDLDISRR